MGRSRRNFSRDAISNLPADIIHSRMSRLPLRDAVRTCILSRKWRYRWISLPELVFDFQLQLGRLSNYQLHHIIFHLLLHDQGSINISALLVSSCRASPDFTLHLYFGPPPRFKGFSRLITLEFHDVDFVPAIFAHFISQCSLLERVRLAGCTNWDSFEVEGPRLRLFTFHGVFKMICFKNSPVLAEVSLSAPMFGNRGIRSSNGFKYFHIPRRNCTCIQVHWSSWVREAYQLDLLHSCGKAVIEYIRAQEAPDRCLHQLRRLEIAPFSGFEPEIEFVRYLLASAAGHEELVIETDIPALTGGVSLMNLLKQLPRASPSARLVVRRR